MNQAIALFEFDGGIHPPENKHQSTQKPLSFVGFPHQLILPLHQHVGAAARPVVNTGDHVLKGQLLAEAHGVLSVPVHAPTSGTLIAIEDRHVPHASGLTDRCLIIEPDGKDQWIPHPSLLEQQQASTVEDIDPLDIVAFIRDSGITGMGGAGFPTAVKLHGHEHLGEGHKSQRHDIDQLILNAAECEPYITADDTLMRERAIDVIRGTQILLHILGAAECLIGIEDNKPEAINALQQAVTHAAEQDRIQVVVIPTKYPSGGEKQLIKVLTGQEVPSGGIPANIGIVCQNVATAAAIARAVDHGEPLLSRITTVTGDAIEQPRNWEVLLGTPIEHLLEASGYQPQSLPRVIMGGPMMGFTLPNLDVPIIKTSNCLLAPTAKELPPNDMAMACIRCGQCADACPSDLLPQQLYWFSKADEFDKADQHNLFDCIECGACSYVCPSQIPLVQYYRYAKGAIREERAASLKAEQAKERFEARQARQEREKAEKEAKRKARAEAAAAAKAAKAASEAKSATDQASAPAAVDVEKLQQQLTTVKAALVKSEDKLAAAQADGGDEKIIQALTKAIEKSKTKIATLEQTIKSSASASTPAAVDVDKLNQQLTTVKAVLVKSQEKLAAAQADGSDEKIVKALVTAVDKAKAKIATLEQTIESAAGSSTPAAIDLDKLKQQLTTTKAVLAKSEEKLAAAVADGGDDKIVSALTKAIEKSKTKIATLENSIKSASTASSDAKETTDDEAVAALKKKLLAQQDRVAKATERLNMAKAEGLDTVDALQRGVDKQQEKLQQLQAQLEPK